MALDPTQDPNVLRPPLFNPGNPFSQGPGLGFQLWAQDPQNATKVQPSMTSPTSPLQPNAPNASATPPVIEAQPSGNPYALPDPGWKAPPAAQNPDTMAAPAAGNPALPNIGGPTRIPAMPTQQQDIDANPGLYQSKIATGKVGNILNMIAATSLGLAGGMKGDPSLGAKYAAQTAAHDEGVAGANQTAYNQRWIQPQKDAAALADVKSQTAQRQAAADKANAQSESYAPITLTKEQAESIGHPELEGQALNSKAYTLMLTGKQKADSAESIAGGKNQTAAQIAADRNERILAGNAEANKTKVLLQQMKDSTSQANTGARIAAKGAGASAATGGKVPSDVTKRAALAANVMENADAINGIVQRRPDLFGATGGRYTSVQQMIGSNDPDISATGVRMHNIALASNGAHGLRSAEAVAQTENELFNHWKTGPQGLAGGLNALRGSVQTFLDDEKNFQNTGSRTGGNALKPPSATGGGAKPDPMGIL